MPLRQDVSGLAERHQARGVWKVLGAVKTEFECYGEWVARIREQVQKASYTLNKADTRTRQMRRALKVVEALPDAAAQTMLPVAGGVGLGGCSINAAGHAASAA